MREEQTRGIPLGEHEFAWARNRPAADRTPLPEAGDDVLYRHDEWGDVMPATVEWVQPADDHDDPMLWRVDRDPATGGVFLHEGKPMFVAVPDPWPSLRLKVPGLGLVTTREARLRGSPGWLPLDWERRRRPLPYFIDRTSQANVDGQTSEGPAPIEPPAQNEAR